ncbi:hypothetical protein C8Q74DRAFT_592466 [Fomes fomentarius]|nr:hypothetical protein C8Q74DRAFT_592466 [Fomes fomentarius]
MGMLNLVGGLGSVFIDLFTPILISRFLIDLQTANRRSQHINILSDIEISNIEGFIGSLGTSLPGNIPAHAEQDDCRHNGMVQDDHTWDTDSHA